MTGRDDRRRLPVRLLPALGDYFDRLWANPDAVDDACFGIVDQRCDETDRTRRGTVNAYNRNLLFTIIEFHVRNERPLPESVLTALAHALNVIDPETLAMRPDRRFASETNFPCEAENIPKLLALHDACRNGDGTFKEACERVGVSERLGRLWKASDMWRALSAGEVRRDALTG